MNGNHCALPFYDRMCYDEPEKALGGMTMKRLFISLLALSLLLSLAACGAKPEPTETLPGTQPGNTEPVQTEAPTEAPSYETGALELVSNENVTFTVTEFRHNEHLGLEMHVYCENKTEKNMMFSLDGVSVMGIMYDPFWAEEVSAGKKVNSVIYFDTFQLQEMGITSVDEISFRLTVIDNDEWMDEPFVDEVFTVYPTGMDAASVVYPEYQHKNGETVIVDGDLLFIVEKVDDTDSDCYTLNCYIANRTDKDLLVSWDGVSVNSFMVDPFWAAAVGAGKQLYTQISFYNSDLEAQGIENVSEIEFTLTAYDYESFDGEAIVEETCVFQPK